MTSERANLTRIAIGAAFLAALAIRVLFIVEFRVNFDLESYRQDVEILRRGGALYEETSRYNYSPVWAYVSRGVARVSEAAGIPFGTGIGTLLLMVDVATAGVLYRLAGRGRRGSCAALLFFANPVSVFATGYYLQFDNLSILFLLLAIEAFRGEPPRRAWASVALAASLLAKHITAFFPLLFARGRRLGWAGTAFPYVAFAASFTPFIAQWAAIREHVFRYQSLNEDFGVAMLWYVHWLPFWLPKALFYGAAAAAILAFGRNPPALAALRLFLVMLIFIPGVCEYYVVWPIALGSLFGGFGYFVYTLVAATTFFGSVDGLAMPLTHLPGWHGIWWSLVLWLAWDLRQRGILETR